MRYPASLGIILLGLAVGISGEHSQRPHNGGFVVRHRDTRGHKRRVHEQNVSSSTSSHGHTMERSDRGHALIEGNLRHTDSATAAEELQSGPSEARQSRRAAAVREQDRDNIFVDRTKPTVVAAPGENVTIKCVTPWIDMVNAWKKNDVVLESGQPGVEMTSVRLPSDQLKGFIDKMVGMEAEEEKLLARKAELAESARVNKASLGDGISGVGEGAGSRTRPANRGKTGGDDPKQAGKIGEDSGEDVESKSIESDDQEAADADEDEPEQNNKDVERGVVDQSGVAHRHRQGRTHRSATRSKQQTPKGPSDRLKAMFSQGQKLELWTLRLHNVSTSDEGNYTCGGEAVTYFHLRVEEPEEEFPTTSESTEPAGSEIMTNEEQTKFGLAVLVNPKLQKLILKCNYTGSEDHGDATYAWYKDEDLIEEGSKYHIETTGAFSILTVENCKVEDAGNYRCKLKDEEATLRVLMYPTLEHVERSKTQVQGEKLRLACKARGSPTPKITWLKDGAELIMDERMEKQDIDGVENAVLIIQKLQNSDRGDYVCQATSLNVTTEVKITVRVKDRYAALWPFLGICAEVAILCTIIFIYERRRTKPEFEDEDDKKESSSHRK